MSEPVHAVEYASQPDLQIWCDDSWTTPRYGGSDQVGQPYRSADGRLYAFDWLVVTCRACLHKLRPSTVTQHLSAQRWRRYLATHGHMPASVMLADQIKRDRMRAFVAKHGSPIADVMSFR